MVKRQHNVWCVCVAFCGERCAGRQHNVWCVCVAFCVERYAVEVICGNAEA